FPRPCPLPSLHSFPTRRSSDLKVLLCPSDFLQQNPITSGTAIYALTSYGGNGGSRSYDPLAATNDGVFYVTGPGSETAPGGQPIDRKSTRLNSSHVSISYAVFC